MPGLTWNSAAGNLRIGGQYLNTPGYKVLNLHEMWAPAPQRGQDRIVPGSNGVRPFRRRDTVATYDLQMFIIGAVYSTGSPYGISVFEGLQANVANLIATFVTPTGTGDGTRTAILTLPDGTTRTKQVHVTGLEFGEASKDGAWLRAVMSISSPTGRFI